MNVSLKASSSVCFSLSFGCLALMTAVCTRVLHHKPITVQCAVKRMDFIFFLNCLQEIVNLSTDVDSITNTKINIKIAKFSFMSLVTFAQFGGSFHLCDFCAFCDFHTILEVVGGGA